LYGVPIPGVSVTVWDDVPFMLDYVKVIRADEDDEKFPHTILYADVVELSTGLEITLP